MRVLNTSGGVERGCLSPPLATSLHNERYNCTTLEAVLDPLEMSEISNHELTKIIITIYVQCVCMDISLHVHAPVHVKGWLAPPYFLSCKGKKAALGFVLCCVALSL